jgi:hypothetical protein
MILSRITKGLKVISMLSRSESQKIKKSKRNTKIRSRFFRFINFVFKTYMYIGFTVFSAVTVVSVIYKSYWHQEPPFNYQKYIHSNTQLVVVLTTVFTSFLISGVIALGTEQKKNPVQKKVEKTVDKKIQKRRLHKAG